MAAPEALLALLFACVRGAEGGKSVDGVDPGPSGPASDGTVPLTDANNYTYEGALDGPSFPLAEFADATLDWSALHTDLQCHALDPVADIDNTALLAFPYLSEEEVEAGLSDETLSQVDMEVYLSYLPGDDTHLSLSDFTFFGTEADIQTRFQAGAGTFLVLLTTGTEVAIGARMLAFLTPTTGETATTATLEDGCSVLDFSADLASLEPVPVLRDGPWKFDWSALTRNGRGGEFVPTRTDALMIAHFDLTADELADQFLDIESLATESWTYDLGAGTAVDLGTLDGPSGPFPGFDEGGLWVLALRCGTCPNPAPLFLTVLVPE